MSNTATEYRKPDSEPEYSTLDAVCEDCMHAFHTKDVKMLKAAFEALIEHIQEQDSKQDREEFNGTV